MASAKRLVSTVVFCFILFFGTRICRPDITQINDLYRHDFNEILDIMTYSCDSSSSSSSSEDEDDLDFLLLDSLFCTKRETQGALDFRTLSDTEFVENFRQVNSGMLKLLKQLHVFFYSQNCIYNSLL